MTRIYIPFQDGIPANSNFYSAYVGFREMGFETAPYFAPDTLDGVGREDIVVGGIGACQSVLARFGVDVPTINYPPSLSRFLGRKVRIGNVERMIAESQGEPLFVKSLRDKQFTGKVVRNVGDIVGWLGGTEEVDAIASGVVDFRSEWRCFVRYGEVLDVRPYHGDWRLGFDAAAIEDAVAAYEDAPSGYGLDIGVTSDGRTLLVEVNDGYALGSYGLQSNLYAQLLSARWSELMGVPDELGYLRPKGY